MAIYDVDKLNQSINDCRANIEALRIHIKREEEKISQYKKLMDSSKYDIEKLKQGVNDYRENIDSLNTCIRKEELRIEVYEDHLREAKKILDIHRVDDKGNHK